MFLIQRWYSTFLLSPWLLYVFAWSLVVCALLSRSWYWHKVYNAVELMDCRI